MLFYLNYQCHGKVEYPIIILSEEDYSSLIETLYLLSNPANAEKLLQAKNRSVDDAISWEDVKNELNLSFP